MREGSAMRKIKPDNSRRRGGPQPNRKTPIAMPACLSPALLEFALEQEPEECARLLGRPLQPQPPGQDDCSTSQLAQVPQEAAQADELLPDPMQPAIDAIEEFLKDVEGNTARAMAEREAIQGAGRR